jgi:hypothetical protein
MYVINLCFRQPSPKSETQRCVSPGSLRSLLRLQVCPPHNLARKNREVALEVIERNRELH